MGIFGLLGIGGFIYNCVKEVCEPKLPAEYHGNWKLEAEDSNKVRFGEMTEREFLRNMKNGKYYAPPKPRNELDPKMLRFYYWGRWHRTLNTNGDWGQYGQYNFIKSLTPEEARDEYFELSRKELEEAKRKEQAHEI